MIRVSNRDDPEGAYCDGSAGEPHELTQLRVAGASGMDRVPVLTRCPTCRRVQAWGPRLTQGDLTPVRDAT